MIDMTVKDLASVFTEWKGRYDANPDSYGNWEDFLADPPESYGEGAARYFLGLIADMAEIPPEFAAEAEAALTQYREEHQK